MQFSHAAAEVCEKEEKALSHLRGILRKLLSLYQSLASGADPSHLTVEGRLVTIQELSLKFEEAQIPQIELESLTLKYQAACEGLEMSLRKDMSTSMGLTYVRVILGGLFSTRDLGQLEHYLGTLDAGMDERELSPYDRDSIASIRGIYGENMDFTIGTAPLTWPSVLHALVDDIQKTITEYPLGPIGASGGREGELSMRAILSAVEWLEDMLVDVQKTEADRRKSALSFALAESSVGSSATSQKQKKKENAAKRLGLALKLPISFN